MTSWLTSMNENLLHTNEWNPSARGKWEKKVNEIQKDWKKHLGQDPFPKLHMLRHTHEFAERHHFLGKASEQALESFHHTFNNLFHKHHFNQAHNTAERLRRCLADTALLAIQPLKKRKIC